MCVFVVASDGIENFGAKERKKIWGQSEKSEISMDFGVSNSFTIRFFMTFGIIELYWGLPGESILSQILGLDQIQKIKGFPGPSLLFP